MTALVVGRLAHLVVPAAVPGATPAPAPVETLDPLSVTPGVLGFLVIFAVVLACIPLFLSMTGKLRKVEHSARRQETPSADGVPAADGPGTQAATGSGGQAVLDPPDGPGAAPTGDVRAQ